MQFKVDDPAQHGFQDVTFSTYGLSECAPLENATQCAKVSSESALRESTPSAKNGTNSTSTASATAILESDILQYQWSSDAVVLKDSIFGLLRALMAVDRKYKEIAAEDIRQADEK